MFKNRKAQSTLEYAIIIAVVVAGLLAMQHYVKRGYMGRLKQGANELGDQFDPNAMSGTITKRSNIQTSTVVADKVTTTTYAAGSGENTTTDIKIDAWDPTKNMYNQ